MMVKNFCRFLKIELSVLTMAAFCLPIALAQYGACENCNAEDSILAVGQTTNVAGGELQSVSALASANYSRFDTDSGVLTIPAVELDGQLVQLTLNLVERTESPTGFGFQQIASETVAIDSPVAAAFDSATNRLTIPVVDVFEGVQRVNRVSAEMQRIVNTDPIVFDLTAAERDGMAVFRYETFGDEQLWTDQLRMHEVIETAVSPIAGPWCWP